MFVVCDESGLGKRFFVIGSAWTPKKHLPQFEKNVSELRLHHKCWGEVKWTKMKNTTPEGIVCFYEDFVKIAKESDIFFRFIIIDTEKLDYKKITEYLQLKFMYLLITRSISYNSVLQEKVQPDQLHILFDKFKESMESRDEGWRIQTKQYIEQYLNSAIEHLQPCDSKLNFLAANR